MNTSPTLNPTLELLEKAVQDMKNSRPMHYTTRAEQVNGFDEEFARAKRHTKKVRLLKIALPAIAIFIILGFMAAMAARSMVESPLGLDSIAITDGKLVMENPRLNGFDDEKRPYNLTADKAVQNIENPSKVTLESILAELPMDDKISATLRAGTGLYDTEARTLLLGDSVFVETNDGMNIMLKDADVDIANGILKTSQPVTAQSDGAEITSDSLLVENNGERIVFDGSVKMTLFPGKLRSDNKADSATNIEGNE